MTDETFIYGLRDPQNGLIYYIGKSNDPERRFKSHLADTLLRQTKVQWLDTMLRVYQRVPTLVILEKVTRQDWQVKERAWIEYGKANGWPLTNARQGGDGPT